MDWEKINKDVLEEHAQEWHEKYWCMVICGAFTDSMPPTD